MIDGAFARASSNNVESARSASPTYFERQSAPLRTKKETPPGWAFFAALSPALRCATSSAEHASANCRARSVLPVPGGPWKRTPRGGATPRDA